MERAWASADVDRDGALAIEDERDVLHRQIREFASSISSLGVTAVDERRMVREVETSNSRYLVRGEVLEVSGTGGPVVIIALERLGTELPSVEIVRDRFGLTRKQASVALLLAQRKSNQEIADELFISPHTARHHTERVLTKLGVHARTDVRSALLANLTN